MQMYAVAVDHNWIIRNRIKKILFVVSISQRNSITLRCKEEIGKYIFQTPYEIQPSFVRTTENDAKFSELDDPL